MQQVRGQQVRIPPTDDAKLLRHTMRDDYLSSVPKFFLGILDMYNTYPNTAWYYIAGDDTFVVVDHLLDRLAPFDASQALYVGGHLDFRRGLNFLGGGAGIIFSNGLMKILQNKLVAPANPKR